MHEQQVELLLRRLSNDVASTSALFVYRSSRRADRLYTRLIARIDRVVAWRSGIVVGLDQRS